MSINTPTHMQAAMKKVAAAAASVKATNQRMIATLVVPKRAYDLVLRSPGP